MPNPKKPKSDFRFDSNSHSFMYKGRHMRGVNNFVDTHLVKDAVQAELLAALGRGIKIVLAPTVKPFTDQTVENVSSARKFSPYELKRRDQYTYGRRIHYGIQRSVNSKKRTDAAAAASADEKSPAVIAATSGNAHVKSILMVMATKGLYPEVKGSEVSVVWPAARIATRVDMRLYCRRRNGTVIAELKTTRAAGYTTVFCHVLSSRLFPIGSPVMRVTALHRDLFQALVTARIHQKQYPEMLVVDVIVVHSPNPAEVAIYAAPKWMLLLVDRLDELMIGTA